MKKLSLLIVPIYVIISAITKNVEWTWIQWLVAIIIAIDVRNAFITKHFYKEKINEKAFPIFHIHTLIIGALFHHSLFWSIFWYLMLNLAVWIRHQSPIINNRQLSIVITVVAIAINVFIVRPPQVFEWVVPLLFVNNVLIKKSTQEVNTQNNIIPKEVI